MMRRSVLALFTVSIFLLYSCHQGNGSEQRGPLFFDYMIWGDEETATITAKLQFRIRGEFGDAVQLQDPAKIEFDGVVLKPDSAKLNGFFYEIAWPSADFTGRHTIIFTDYQGKKYTTAFEFALITLKTAVSPLVARDTLLLNLDGEQEADRLRVVVTDTSFYGKGLEKIDTSRDGQVLITPNEWRNLKSGPVTLEIFREDEKMLAETTQAGGRFWLFYALKRHFILQDSTP
jgi:hypothetical protein